MFDGNDLGDGKPIVIRVPVQHTAWGATTLIVRKHGPTLGSGKTFTLETKPKK